MRVHGTVPLLVSGALVVASSGAGEVVERDLRQAMAYAQRGLGALQKGNVSRAKEDFDRAVAKIPNLPDAHTGFGHLAMREQRFEDALREYRLAESGSREMISVRLLLENERYSRSRDELQLLRGELLQLRQIEARIQMQGGSVTGEGGGTNGAQIQREISEVESRIHTLEGMSPPTPSAADEPPADVLFFQGNALFDLKRTDEAIAVWEAAAKRMQAFGPLHNNLAVAYWKAGRLDDAWASLRRAEAVGFKVNPNFRADLAKAGPEPQPPSP